jgi:hypothetical protein
MTRFGVHTLVAAAWMAAMPGTAPAQFAPPGGAPAPTVQDRWPEPTRPPQATPPQSTPQAPAAQEAPPKRQRTQSSPFINDDAPAAEQPPKPAAPRAPATVVACNGVFAKDSGHMKLALRFDSRNLAYGEVDGPDGSKINASILYPNDPKRRLEVLWNNEASRSDVSVIAINGRSQWVAPKGMKLGLAIAALEKANGRPFKLSGFGADGAASVLGWEGGALSSLPGGCKVGMRLLADPKAPEDARAAAAEKEYLSNDPGVRALKPTVGEILIGY